MKTENIRVWRFVLKHNRQYGFHSTIRLIRIFIGIGLVNPFTTITITTAETDELPTVLNDIGIGEEK